MKNLIITAIVGLLLFGASFAGSSFLLSKSENEDDAKKTEEEQAAITEEGDPFDPNSVVTAPTTRNKTDVAVPFKTKTLSEQQILEMVEVIRQRESELKQREDNVYSRESNHKFILNDIQREKRELEAIQNKVEAKIMEANRVLSEIQDKKKEMDAIKAEIDAGKSSSTGPGGLSDVDNAKTDKTIAEWLQGMPAEKAAETVKEFANSGRLNDIARILSQVEPRNATKILKSLDSTLIQQLMDGIRQSSNQTNLR